MTWLHWRSPGVIVWLSCAAFRCEADVVERKEGLRFNFCFSPLRTRSRTLRTRTRTRTRTRERMSAQAFNYEDVEDRDGVRLSWTVFAGSRIESTRTVVPIAAVRRRALCAAAGVMAKSLD